MYIFNTTITYKSLGYLGAALLSLYTDSPRLQTGSANPTLELLMPLLRGHPQEQRALVQLVFVGLNRTWIPEVRVPPLSRLREPDVVLVEVVQAPILGVCSHLDVRGVCRLSSMISTVWRLFGFDFTLSISTMGSNNVIVFLIRPSVSSSALSPAATRASRSLSMKSLVSSM